VSKLDFIHFYETQNPTLKLLQDGSFSFWTESQISDMEELFAKKPGFLPNQESRVLNFG
jgi:hypothetical protein